AYNESDNVDDVILEIRKMNVDGSVNEKYDARLNISEKKHRDNMNNFLKKNKCKHPVNLSHMGDFEIVRSCSFDNGIEKRWLSTTDYISRKGYGV
ncbi:MAG: hypothetical protein U9O53_00525, partial [archaeon]|nr:hypothetical protein [archaeon]